MSESRGATTRQAILDAAVQRFGRDGYRATSVLAVARDARVGGTATYTYFPTKEALFLAAVDEDVAGVVHDTFGQMKAEPHAPEWPGRTLLAAMESLGRHPLARRVLSGAEPEVAHRVRHTPALDEARKALAERIHAGQMAGLARSDIAAEQLAGGLVGIMLSLLAAGVRLDELGGGAGPTVEREHLRDIMRTLHASVVPGDRARRVEKK